MPRKEEKPNLKESFQSVSRNPPLFIVIGILLWNDEFHSQDGGDALLFIYNVGDPSLIGLFSYTSAQSLRFGLFLFFRKDLVKQEQLGWAPT